MKKEGQVRACTHTKKMAKKLGGLAEEVASQTIVGELVHEKLPVMRPNDGDPDVNNLEEIWQLKWDGTFMFGIKESDTVILPGRSFKSDYSSNHPELVEDMMKIDGDVILTGELVFLDEYGKDHFLTALAMEDTWLDTNYDPEKDKRPKLVLTPRYMVFGIQKWGDHDLTGETQEFKDGVLDAMFQMYDFENMERVKNYVTPEEKEHAWEISNEGIISKRLDSIIKDGRTNQWRKKKKLQAEDFWAIGFTKGTGAREATFGAMLLANLETTEDGCYEYITKTSGFTNEQLRYFLDKAIRNDELPVQGMFPTQSKMMYFFEPILVEIKFQRKTRTGALIMPRFVKERTDITG